MFIEKQKVKCQSYIKSPSTQLGLAIGCIMYLSYGVGHHALTNIALQLLTVFIGFFIPFYSRLSNRIEEKINLATAIITLGRLGRFVPQLVFNVGIFLVLQWGGVFSSFSFTGLGGVLGASLLTTCASQGMQYLGLSLANREIGERNRNIIIALSINIIITALAMMGLSWARTAFVITGIVFGALFFLMGLLSDLRSRFFPKKGVAVFFGTFNPIHRTHLALIRNAIEARNLEKVYIHSTVIPKLHADALKRGDIRIVRREAGMRVYEKTERADVHMNYFPTGSKFYEYETRLHMMRLAIAEAGLAKKVEVLSMPDEYQRSGFYAVLKQVKRRSHGRPIHGIHGSDLGGMWVRSIYDESGWIYPFPVVRRDKVSATAIRNGAKGMATETVERIIVHLREGKKNFSVNLQSYSVNEGVLKYEN
jgi:nicotinic acid mononucleotide adenylyltransferase